MSETDWRAEAEMMVRDQIVARGITDESTIAAMRRIPRHRFIPPARRHLAFADGAVPIASGQTISQPFIVAQMTAALTPRPGERILEIGTGSGYQTAVLAETVAPEGIVFTVERHPELSAQARRLLDDLGYRNVRFHVGDGTLGWPEHAPYDAVMVTAAGPAVPPNLLEQLDRTTGRMVIPVGDRDHQELLRFRWCDGDWIHESFGAVTFVPLIGEAGW
jgi:protein-L-isoaspartate(D-aspartate) O-methyltransferase